MRPGPVRMRIWQLAYRADFGMSMLIDPEALLYLAELILTEGFLGFI